MSFIFNIFCSKLGEVFKDIRYLFEVEVAVGNSFFVIKVVENCRIELSGYSFFIRLYLMLLGCFDVIIGMDWLVTVDVYIVCGQRFVRLTVFNGSRIIIYGDESYLLFRVISMIKAGKLL